MKKNLKIFFLNLYAIVNAFRYVLFQGVIFSPLKKKNAINNYTFAVLGNGPSLNIDLNNALSMNNQVFAALNFFGCTEVFSKVKPQWYFFMDRAFFTDNSRNRRRDDIFRMYDIFNNQVDWEMTIVIPSHYYNDFLNYSKLHNPYIKVISVNTNSVKASTHVSHWLYKRNWAAPAAQNVTILAIYTGINLGYKNIRLYGVDHTFLQGLFVDEQNRLCLKWDHFYDDESEVKPVTDTLGNHPTIASELKTVAITFQSHEELRKYADENGTQIVNCTKGSMIDSYIRESQLLK